MCTARFTGENPLPWTLPFECCFAWPRRPPLDSLGRPIPAAAVKGISANSRLRLLRATVRLHGTPLEARSQHSVCRARANCSGRMSAQALHVCAQCLEAVQSMNTAAA